jgi:hypothetical protein
MPDAALDMNADLYYCVRDRVEDYRPDLLSP